MTQRPEQTGSLSVEVEEQRAAAREPVLYKAVHEQLQTIPMFRPSTETRRSPEAIILDHAERMRSEDHEEPLRPRQRRGARGRSKGRRLFKPQ